MRLRVFQVSRGHNSTQIRQLGAMDISGAASTGSVEGRLVLYRAAHPDGRPRWSHAATTFEATLAMGKRLAVLLDDDVSLWFTSPVVECVQRVGSVGWTVRSENSVYRVEVLVAIKASGTTPLPSRLSLPPLAAPGKP